MTSPSSARPVGLRLCAALTAVALGVGVLAAGGAARADPTVVGSVAGSGAGNGVGSGVGSGAGSGAGQERVAADPRRTRGLFVDPRTPAAQQGPAYAAIARRPQAQWFSDESHSTRRVEAAARRLVTRAAEVRKTPTLVVYAIPDRDCGQHSSGGLPGAGAYRRWVSALARGIRGSKAIVILEPDAIAFYNSAGCANSGDRLRLLRFAVRTIADAGGWVYLDAGHSDWTPYDGRAALLKRAGIARARGFSTNVSNFRPLAQERVYAARLLRDLRQLDVRGVRYVVDTSRNGAANPVSGDVFNPTWARLGARPRLVFQGAFDGRLWVKRPGESDGQVNDGPASGLWCDRLADRLLGRPESAGC